MSLRVVAAGPRTLVQDLGRPGLAALGVSPSGALDPLLLRRANALVGNRRGAACLEVLLGGLVLEAITATALAVVGTAGPELVWLDAGESLQVPQAEALLAYVAVRGGIDEPGTLGSRSTDLLGRLGPPPVAAGRVLRVGDDPGPGEPVPDRVAHRAGDVELRLHPPPRPEALNADVAALLRSTRWVVGSDTGRTAARLDGVALPAGPEELPPEGIVRGAVQVPGGGRPIVFLADHPVTGGYPVAGVVVSADLRLLAQARPGTGVRFTAVAASAKICR